MPTEITGVTLQYEEIYQEQDKKDALEFAQEQKELSESMEE